MSRVLADINTSQKNRFVAKFSVGTCMFCKGVFESVMCVTWGENIIIIGKDVDNIMV